MAIDDNTSYELTGYQVKDLAQKVRAKADSASLASVATSGLYSDLTGAPTIPTVYNGTLTIQHNGTSKGTFTANQSSASTINIETIYADTVAPATAVDPITTSMIADGAVTSGKIDWSTFTYSTSEQRVGTWINGKPIYKKTINFGSLPNNSTKNVAHGISNLGDVIDIRGTAKASWGTYQLPLVFSGSDVNYITNVSINATNISMSNSADRSGFTAYVTLYYTKTTD